MRNFEDDPTLSDLLNGEQLQRLNRILSGLCRQPIELGEQKADERW